MEENHDGADFLHNDLDEQRQTLLNAQEQVAAAAAATDDRTSQSSHQKRLVVRALPFMAFHFLIAFAELVLVAPLLSLFERSLCLSHYAETEPSLVASSFSFAATGTWALDDSLCKIPPIQQELAMIRGWKSSLDTLPVFLVAVPMGKLADRYGKRKALASNLLGVLLAFVEIMTVCAFPMGLPLRLVWASSFILLFGGGLYTTAALMWAIVTEAFDETERSSAMYYVFSAFYVAELVASALASVTMETSPWIGCFMSLAAIVLALCLLSALPSSSPVPAGERTRNNSAFESGLATFREALGNRNVCLAIPVFLVGALRYTVLNILMQYSSIRFGWPLSKTALIYTETAIVTIALFLFIVPVGTSFLHNRYGIPRANLDLSMVRASVFLLSFGALCIALSSSSAAIFTSVLVYATGFGSRVSMLSLLSHWTSDRAKGSFYAAVAVLENIGHAIGDPSLQRIFAATLGDSQEGSWGRSLPFFCASAVYGIAIVSTFGMRATLNRTDNDSRSHVA